MCLIEYNNMNKCANVIISTEGVSYLKVGEFYFRIGKFNGNKHYWRCRNIKRGCKASAITEYRNNRHFIVKTSRHTHDEEQGGLNIIERNKPKGYLKKKEEDITGYPLIENQLEEDGNLEDIGFENTKDSSKELDINSDYFQYRDNSRISDNLMQLIETLVIKNLKQNKVENNNRLNEQNMKISEKNQISLKSNAIKKKTEAPSKKMEKKVAFKSHLNWIYVK